MRSERAEAVAVAALSWLARREDDLGRFLAASGLDPADLRGAARAPEFLGAVLDFILAEERLARAFVEEEGLGPEDALAARAALPGGDAPHWT